MTRKPVYAVAVVVFIAATAMTITSILLPSWISYRVFTPGGSLTKTIGLHRSCYTVDGTTKCHSFPQDDDCHTSDRYFCSIWRSVGFMMSFTAVVELVTLVAYMVIIGGGRAKREGGWKILAFLLFLVGMLQCAAMSLVAYLYDNDDRFFIGWELGNAWILCTISWSIAILSSVFLSLSAYVFPSEGGYELIPSERYGRPF
ncbi:hypothetical protein BJ878DRAFT_427101 [Calycina marina]|uniref:Uncharacterized protein n=1 Tax=Calycina marina TaxID=1763456 RepID=A0A9P8CCP7_9HELO|nr:hypothetical protein BJ878DRAFT_427101 [Calycina marina]